MRDRFWELPLEALDQQEWEALCDGCGRCCTHKIEDADTGDIEHTNVACKLLDTQTARCTDYARRKAFVPDCLQLKLRLLPDIRWLPETCAYMRRHRGEALPDWHYLVSGDRNGVITAGVSVAGRVIPEDDAGPVEHHVVDWDG